MTTPESSHNSFKNIPPGSRVPPELARDLLEAAKSAPREASQASQSERRDQGVVSPREALEIMGEQDFIGPDQLKSIFGREVADVPPIPFSAQELREAKERGEFLILRTDSLGDAKDLTMQNLHAYFEGDFKMLASATDQWKLDSNFFTKETPEVSWALVSKDFIPNTTSKNYFEQTRSIVAHLKDTVYQGGTPPAKYQEAIDEFEAYSAGTFPGKSPQEIQTEIGGTKWKQYAEQLSKLKINQLCRQSAVEALFDIAVYYKHTNRKLLESPYTWTKSRASDGRLGLVGFAGAAGAHVGRWGPGNSDGVLGVLLSRR